MTGIVWPKKVFDMLCGYNMTKSELFLVLSAEFELGSPQAQACQNLSKALVLEEEWQQHGAIVNPDSWEWEHASRFISGCIDAAIDEMEEAHIPVCPKCYDQVVPGHTC